jgi:hypothetical protein
VGKARPSADDTGYNGDDEDGCVINSPAVSAAGRGRDSLEFDLQSLRAANPFLAAARAALADQRDQTDKPSIAYWRDHREERRANGRRRCNGFTARQRDGRASHRGNHQRWMRAAIPSLSPRPANSGKASGEWIGAALQNAQSSAHRRDLRLLACDDLLRELPHERIAAIDQD